MILDAPPQTFFEQSDCVYLSGSPSTWTSEVSVYGLLPWKLQTIYKILGLSNLEENWDSYGGKPTDQIIINKTVELIQSLSFPYDEMPLPAVIPTSEGGLQLEWSEGGKELEIEIRSSGDIEWFMCQNGEPIEEGFVKEIAQLNSLVSWVFAV